MRTGGLNRWRFWEEVKPGEGEREGVKKEMERREAGRRKGWGRSLESLG